MEVEQGMDHLYESILDDLENSSECFEDSDISAIINDMFSNDQTKQELPSAVNYTCNYTAEDYLQRLKQTTVIQDYHPYTGQLEWFYRMDMPHEPEESLLKYSIYWNDCKQAFLINPVTLRIVPPDDLQLQLIPQQTPHDFNLEHISARRTRKVRKWPESIIAVYAKAVQYYCSVYGSLNVPDASIVGAYMLQIGKDVPEITEILCYTIERRLYSLWKNYRRCLMTMYRARRFDDTIQLFIPASKFAISMPCINYLTSNRPYDLPVLIGVKE